MKNYQLYSYPIQIASKLGCGVGDPQSTWIVGGLVDPAQLWTEAATLSPRETAVMVLLLVLGIAAVPLSKLLLLQSNERFRFIDACILLPSAILVLMIGTILLLAWGAHGQLDDLAATGLKDLSAHMESRMTAEFKRARLQLLASEDAFADRLKRSCAEGVQKTIPEYEDVFHFLATPQEALRPAIYPDLASVWWMSPDGWQVFKADVHSETTTREQLAERPYFRELAEGRRWYFDDDKKSADAKAGFFIESLRNDSTGELATVLSVPSRVCKDKDYIAAISMAPLFVEHPSLPAGYKFAVIAADGQVLYHSDSRRILKEDFFSELGDPDQLHAAMQGLQPGHDFPYVITTTYGRVPVDLRVRKMKWRGPQWFLVTLRDRRWLEAANTEALAHATAWCLAAWAPLLAGLVVCVLLRSGRKDHEAQQGVGILTCLWPDPRRARLYRFLFAAECSLCAAGLVFQWLWPRPGSGALFAFPMAFPWAALALAISIGRLVPDGTSSPIAWARWHTLAAASLWGALAIVPAAGLYRHAWHRALDKVNAFEARQQQAHGEDWGARDRSFYKQKMITVAAEGDDRKCNEDVFFDARRSAMTQFGVDYSGSSAGLKQSRLEGWLDQRQSRLEDWLDRFLPFYDEQVEAFRFQPPAVEAAASSKGTAVCQAAGELPVSRRPYYLSDQSGAWFFTWISAFACFGAGVSAYWWLRVHIRKLFWTSLARPAAVAGGGLFVPPFEELWRRFSRDEQLTLIQVAQEGFANPSNRAAVERLLHSGFLKLDPSLAHTNKNLEKFAHERAASVEIKALERPTRAIGWHGARWILLAVLVFGLIFAAGTGQTWLKSATTVMTMLAGGLEALWKLLGAVQRPRSG